MDSQNALSPAELRRLKKKRRNTQKFIAFIVIVTVVLGLYVSKERWMPNFTIDNSGYTDDEISAGAFPLRVSNNTNYKICPFNGGITVLTDTRIYQYQPSGETEQVYTNSLSNTVLINENGKTLIYEQNGTGLRVDSKRGLMYEKIMEQSIYLASVSSKGYTAVVTESDQYVCELHVYDNSGDEVYFRGCTERITDVEFKAESLGCYIVFLNVSEGHIVSEISSVDFSEKDTQWKADRIQTCPVSLKVTADDGLVLFGDSLCTFYSASGDEIMTYQYPGELTDTSWSDSGAVMIFRSEERKTTVLSVISDPTLCEANEFRIPDKFSHVLAWDDGIYMLSETEIEKYGYDGKATESRELAEPFRGFCKSGRYIYLEGHRKIEKIEF